MNSAPSRKLRIAILADYREEGWPSMDLVAEMLVASLSENGTVEPTLICPPMPRPAEAWLGPRGRNLDRLMGRFWHYPRAVERLAGQFDVFHLVDHSYSQILHALPAQRCLVTCHDLDTFRCLLPVEAEPRPWWFRQMAGRILRGMQKAGQVTCVSDSTRRELATTGWLPAGRLSVTPNGISEEYFLPESEETGAWANDWLRQRGLSEAPFLLHVGSTIARKRIDVLLKVLAGVVRESPGLQLVRVGAPFTAEQRDLVRELGLGERIHLSGFLDRSQLAALYRRAILVLQPSSYEGFGLPVAEAQACGAVVIASRIPALEEVGGVAARYCEVGAESAWIRQIIDFMALRETDANSWQTLSQASRANAERFRWSGVARSLVERYQYLAGIMN